jgi:hypothetical protein
MQTRSQTKYVNTAKYEVIIDFDGASEAWKANKKSIGQSSYKYVCQKYLKSGKSCNKKCIAGEHYCKTHLTNIQK